MSCIPKPFDTKDPLEVKSGSTEKSEQNISGTLLQWIESIMKITISVIAVMYSTGVLIAGLSNIIFFYQDFDPLKTKYILTGLIFWIPYLIALCISIIVIVLLKLRREASIRKEYMTTLYTLAFALVLAIVYVYIFFLLYCGVKITNEFSIAFHLVLISYGSLTTCSYYFCYCIKNSRDFLPTSIAVAIVFFYLKQ